MKLFCVFVGMNSSAFSVDIDESDTVGDLKDAIKTEKANDLKSVDADRLRLYLAKRGNSWLPSRDDDVVALKKGEIPNGIASLLTEEMEAAFRIDNQMHFGKNFVPSEGDIHVLVDIRHVSTIESALSPSVKFSWRPPKPLVSTAGTAWDFQNPLDLPTISEAIRRHYQAWGEGMHDKRRHPVFMCLGGPGTGKSRLLDEFPTVVQRQVFGDEGSEDQVMMGLLKNAFTFKVTFENGTTAPGQFANPAQAIGTRMLYQLQDSLEWGDFVDQRANHVTPDHVLRKLAEIVGTPLGDMCVILCVDSMQKLEHEPGSKHSPFYVALSTLCDLVNASKCWLIAICSSTVYQPVNEFLAASSQWLFEVQTAELSCPTMNTRMS
ncbi:hypothetical protein FI667_g9722, partial [Globisporangium splendens]